MSVQAQHFLDRLAFPHDAHAEFVDDGVVVRARLPVCWGWRRRDMSPSPTGNDEAWDAMAL